MLPKRSERKHRIAILKMMRYLMPYFRMSFTMNAKTILTMTSYKVFPPRMMQTSHIYMNYEF